MSETAWYETTKLDDRSIDVDGLEPVAPLARVQVNEHGAVAPRRSEYTELAELARIAGPRDAKALLVEARRVGELLAGRAFYDFPVGDKRAKGPTIDLMDALATVWGRVVTRVSIVDVTPGRVRLRGHVIDLLTLTAVERDYESAVMPAPGGFAKKPDQVERWNTMQMQVGSSKAIRAALEHALPAWFVDAALEAARWADAQNATGGKPLGEARAEAVKAFADVHKLDRATLEAWVEEPIDLWTTAELRELRELFASLKSGEQAVEHVRAVAAVRTPAATATADPGRMAGLNLQPAQQQAAATATPPDGNAGVTPGAAKSAPSGEQTWSSELRERVEQADAEHARLLIALQELAKDIPEGVRDSIKRKHNARRVGKSTPIETLRMLVDAYKAAAVKGPSAEPPPSNDDVLAQIADFEEVLSKEKVHEAARASGAPVLRDDPNEVDVDASSPEDLAAYLRELRARAG